MKTLYTHWGAAALAALMLSACADKDFTPEVSDVVEADQTRYLTVALSDPTAYVSRATQADAFENGVTDESAVKELVFVFYDGSGVPTAQAVNLSGDAVAENLWNNGTLNPAPAVTKFWTSVIPVNMTQGQNKPVYVMCFVNPIDKTGLTTMTLSELDAATRKRIVSDDGYFVMSNSVYYGNNPITGQSNVRMMATPIVEDQLYATEIAAQDAVTNAKNTGDYDPLINIYVERFSAKIGVSMKPAAIEDYPVMIAGPDGTYTESAISFVPVFWRPNAIDLNTYITKGFATTVTFEESGIATAAPYTAMNEAFANSGMPGDGINGWNDAANFRSYWACSPSYYATEYPHCSDNITDVTNEGNPYPYALKYFSFNEINANLEGAPVRWNAENGFTPMASADGKTTTGYFYSRETTAAIEELTANNINNKAVPASAVIVGNYRLKDAEANPTFYLYGRINGNDVYYTDANIEQALISNQNGIFTNDQGTVRATSTDLFVVKHPSKAVRGDQNVAGRLVTIQIDEDNIPTGLYFYNGEEYVQVDANNVVAANELLWASASTAQKFYQGLAFFSIPVRHLGWGNNVEPGKPLLSQNGSGNAYMINWQNLRRGDLGVVRNHVYSIEVTKVSGLGVGLENPDQPIVPPMDPDNYYVATRLNILPWRVVPTASIVL